MLQAGFGPFFSLSPGVPVTLSKMAELPEGRDCAGCGHAGSRRISRVAAASSASVAISGMRPFYMLIPTMRSVALLVFLIPIAFARPKNDTVTLVNGNAITCEIERLSRGVLSAKTDSLSTISIRWEDVKRIQSEFIFEIILTDGTTHLGALNPDADGALLMAGFAAAPLVNVVSLTHIESRFINRFDGSVDLGYSLLKSNSTQQLNFDGDLGYTTKNRSITTDVSSTLLVRDKTDTTSRISAGLDVNQTLSRNYFAFVIGQFSSNTDLNLLQRYLGGGALGRYLKRTNRSIITVYGGGAYSTEHYSGSGRSNNGEALLGASAQLFRLHSPKLDITGDFKLWPNLTTGGRYRMDAQFKARIEVYKDLFVAATYWDNYDSKSPSTVAPLNDYGVTLTLGYSFNR
jgi:hypothetical protein